MKINCCLLDKIYDTYTRQIKPTKKKNKANGSDSKTGATLGGTQPTGNIKMESGTTSALPFPPCHHRRITGATGGTGCDLYVCF